MVEVEKGATDYQSAFYDVSNAYNESAKSVGQCNIRLDEALELQKELIRKHKEKNSNANN